MEITHWKKKLEKELLKEIKLSMQIEFFLKANWCSRKSKLQLYWSVIGPIVVYDCESWVLKESIL